MKQRGSLTLPSPAGGISQSDADARYFRIANNLSEGVAATMRTSLGLGSIATQAAGAVAITGGTLAGITGAGFRDTSAAFDVSLVFTSAIPLDAGRTVTVDVGNGNRSFSLWGDFVVPDGGGIAALLGADNSFTGANTFHNAAGLVVRPSGLQDGVALKGRAGGTFSYTAAITTAALTASRTFTIPAVNGNDTFALLGIAQTFTAANIFSANGAASTPALSLTGTIFTGGSAITTKPKLLIETSGATSTNWSTSGTALGVNAGSGFTGNLIDLQTNATNLFKVSGSDGTTTIGDGVYVLSGGITTGFQVWTNFPIRWNTTNSTQLFGGVSDTLEVRSSTRAQTFRVFGTYTDASNYVRAAINTTSTTVVLACETAGTGADNIDLGLTPAGTGLVAFSNAASVDAAVVSTHTARVKFNGTEYKVLLATP